MVSFLLLDEERVLPQLLMSDSLSINQRLNRGLKTSDSRYRVERKRRSDRGGNGLSGNWRGRWRRYWSGVVSRFKVRIRLEYESRNGDRLLWW